MTEDEMLEYLEREIKDLERIKMQLKSHRLHYGDVIVRQQAFDDMRELIYTNRMVRSGQ